MPTPESEPTASAVLEVLNGFVLHAEHGNIKMTCSWRDPIAPGARNNPKKCAWFHEWGAAIVGIPIRLAMDTAVEHLAKEHGA
jgi:hypothetical protein